MKLRTWILATLLLGSTYILFRWITRPLPGALAQGQVLIHTDTADIQAIYISQNHAKELAFTREKRGWLVSNGTNSSWVADSAMQLLLEGISGLTSLEMRKNIPNQSPAVQVALKDGMGNTIDRFRFIRPHPDSIWLGFPDVPEMYRVPTRVAKGFFQPPPRFLPFYFLSWEFPDSLAYGPDTARLTFRRPDTLWLFPSVALNDSLRIHQWLRNLPELVLPTSPRPIPLEFDSIQVKNEMYIWDSGQLIRIRGLKTRAGLGAWSSQRSEEWLERVDSSWYAKLFPVWLDSLVYLEN